MVENNRLGPEKSSSIRKGLIREFQQGILLDIQSAKGLISGLQQTVKIHEDRILEENIKAANH